MSQTFHKTGEQDLKKRNAKDNGNPVKYLNLNLKCSSEPHADPIDRDEGFPWGF